MPHLLNVQNLASSAIEIVKNPAVLNRKIRTLRKYDLLAPVAGHTRLGEIAMFHSGRCGSTVLGKLLDQHPQMYWGGEIYYPLLRAARPHVRAGETIEIDARALLAKSSRWVGKRYFGFEVKFMHLSETGMSLADYYGILEERGVVQYILLERRNYLKMLVSKLILQYHGRVEVKKSEKTSLLQIYIPIHGLTPYPGQRPQTMFEFFDDFERLYAETRALLRNEQVLNLYFEDDILADPAFGYQRACEFIGLDPVAVDAPTRRANPYPLRDSIINYAEVEQAMLNTRFEWMLYDEG